MSPAESLDSAVQIGMPAGMPGVSAVQSQAARENFPVAMRLLPRDVRTDLLAVYGFARLTDDLGDTYPGDRLAALAWLECDLHASLQDRAQHPLVAALGPTIRRRGLDVGLFEDLIEANRRDQRQHRYATFDDLMDYCRQSADPVGRLVLAIFGASDPALLPLSDDVCSGLQVVEHLQDVREDLQAGRVYLPEDDRLAFGCSEADLALGAATPEVRRLVMHLCGRARTLLESGTALTSMLDGRARVAIAGFVAGGRAALDAIEAVDGDVLAHRCRPTKRRLVAHMAALLTPRSTRRHR